jgi:hypothetical protein
MNSQLINEKKQFLIQKDMDLSSAKQQVASLSLQLSQLVEKYDGLLQENDNLSQANQLLSSQNLLQQASISSFQKDLLLKTEETERLIGENGKASVSLKENENFLQRKELILQEYQSSLSLLQEKNHFLELTFAAQLQEANEIKVENQNLIRLLQEKEEQLVQQTALLIEKSESYQELESKSEQLSTSLLSLSTTADSLRVAFSAVKEESRKELIDSFSFGSLHKSINTLYSSLQEKQHHIARLESSIREKDHLIALQFSDKDLVADDLNNSLEEAKNSLKQIVKEKKENEIRNDEEKKEMMIEHAKILQQLNNDYDIIVQEKNSEVLSLMQLLNSSKEYCLKENNEKQLLLLQLATMKEDFQKKSQMLILQLSEKEDFILLQEQEKQSLILSKDKIQNEYSNYKQEQQKKNEQFDISVKELTLRFSEEKEKLTVMYLFFLSLFFFFLLVDGVFLLRSSDVFRGREKEIFVLSVDISRNYSAGITIMENKLRRIKTRPFEFARTSNQYCEVRHCCDFVFLIPFSLFPLVSSFLSFFISYFFLRVSYLSSVGLMKTKWNC